MKKVVMRLYPVGIMALLLLLSACAISDEQIVEEAKKTLDEKMTEEARDVTYEDEFISFYLPSYTDIKNIDEYNYMLERDGYTFLLFLNDLEYYEDINAIKEVLLIEEEPLIAEFRKKENGQQSYLIVTKFDEDEYKVVVGYDGVKLTTIMELSELSNRADMMFDIAQSVR